MNPIAEVVGLSKRFGKDLPLALNQITTTFPRGKIIGLVGPDGAGKTTFIRLLAGLLLPTEGTITIEGKDTVKDAREICFQIGYMPQKFGLYEDLTVHQNLTLYADLSGILGEERIQTFSRLLSFTALSPFQNRFAKDLSGGMKQKLGLACALLRKPKLLLLDEPSVGVDPISRRELWTMIQGLMQEGMTVLWSTSYLDEATKCDLVLLLNEGKLLYQGPPLKLIDRVEGRVFKIEGKLNKPRQLLAKLIQEESVLDAVISGSHIHFVLKDKSRDLKQVDSLAQEHGGIVSPDTPLFEDAFIDILGGCPETLSVLAEHIPTIESDHSVVIEADLLTKKFGSFTAAQNISFKVKKGEVFGLLGPNGAGKSTTFKLLCGLLTPTGGRSFVNGVSMNAAPSQARAQLGYMAQKFSLYGNLSVLQNLEFFSGIYNLSGQSQTEMIDLMVSIFNFKTDETTDSLPLGFKQRLALSCAVMHHPKILFLDEPTSGVDPITRREFWIHINGLVERGVTVIVTTHFMEEAEYCDRIALIYKSKMIEMGTPEELKKEVSTKENPSPTFEDAFIGLIKRYEAKEQ